MSDACPGTVVPTRASSSGEWHLLRPDGSRCSLSLHCAGRFVDRLRGLLGLGPLAQGHGLWLVPCKAVHSFGMRAPIDLLFVDADFEVVAVRSMFAPWRVALCRRARSTIEMAPGDVTRLRITVGSRLVLERPASTDFRPESMGRALDARRSFPGLPKRS